MDLSSARSSLPLLSRSKYVKRNSSFWAALPFASFAAHGHRPETRFCAFFLFLSVATVTVTAFFFALDYRLYYAQWHAPFATRTWLFQFVFISGKKYVL